MMLRHFLLCGIFLVLSTVAIADDGGKRYGIKSGVIHYTVSGGGSMMGIKNETSGTSTTIFKDWGRVELNSENTKTVVMGQTQEEKSMTKIDKDIVYVVDFDGGYILKMMPAMLSQSQHKDMMQSGKEMMQAMGGKKVGEESYKGYDCEVWEAMQTKLWIHKGVVLKSETNVMGFKHFTEASEIKFNIKVLDKQLQLPELPIKTTDDLMSEGMSHQGDVGMPQLSPEEMEQMKSMMKQFSQ